MYSELLCGENYGDTIRVTLWWTFYLRDPSPSRFRPPVAVLSRHERDLAAPRRSAFGVRVAGGRETCGRDGRGLRPWQPPAETGAAHQPVVGPS